MKKTLPSSQCVHQTYIISLTLLALMLPSVVFAEDEIVYPTVDLPEYRVVSDPDEIRPKFDLPSPRFSYFETPALPNGGMIIALEFMDRYRDARVGGDLKWAGMLSFPVIDGYERPHNKLLCFYLADGQLYGFDPTAMREWDRRFVVPMSYSDKSNREMLFQFATQFVAETFPEVEEEIYIEDQISSEEMEEFGGSMDGTYETIYIPAGRISPVTSSQKGKEPRELVKLIYQYTSPNVNPKESDGYGPAEDKEKVPFKWSSFFGDFAPPEDPLVIAAELIKPRWDQEIAIHYSESFIFGIKRKVTQRVLLFNIGKRLYAYDPDFGVWKTKATIDDILNGGLLDKKIPYPGAPEILSIEFINREETK